MSTGRRDGVIKQAVDATSKATTKLDATTRYLVSHTPAEIETYVQTNVTNLATAKDIIAKLAVIVAHLAKRELAD